MPTHTEYETAAAIYGKLRNGDSISDDELKTAIRVIGSMLLFFDSSSTRPVFYLTLRELRSSMNTLLSFRDARARMTG